MKKVLDIVVIGEDFQVFGQPGGGTRGRFLFYVIILIGISIILIHCEDRLYTHLDKKYNYYLWYIILPVCRAVIGSVFISIAFISYKAYHKMSINTRKICYISVLVCGLMFNLWHSQSFVDLHVLLIGDTIQYLFYSVVNSGLCFGIVKSVLDRHSLRIIGKRSLVIMAVHYPIITLVGEKLDNIGIANYSLLWSFVVFVVSISISLIFAIVVEIKIPVLLCFPEKCHVFRLHH